MDLRPEITAAPGTYSVRWDLPEVLVIFVVDRVRSHSDGRVTANVTVKAKLATAEQLTPTFGQLNLTSTQSRKGLWRNVAERVSVIEAARWDRLGEETCRLILERECHVYEVERLTTTNRLAPSYLFGGLLLGGVANLIFAPGGSGKSLVGLYLAILAENGLTLDLQPRSKVNTLFLDYETSRDETARRSTLLIEGLERSLSVRQLTHPMYGRGLGTLADRVTDIARVVAENEIGLLVIDSAGAAAGGDILTAETAVRFFDAVRTATASTGATSLIFSHVTKNDSRQDDSHRAPVGSVFFTNLSRLVWELRPQDSDREDVLQIGLFCRKANSRRPAPIGFRLTFEDGSIGVDRCEAADVVTEAGLTQQIILDELEHGPATLRELVELTGSSQNSVSKTLSKLKKTGLVDNPTRGSWCLNGARP